MKSPSRRFPVFTGVIAAISLSVAASSANAATLNGTSPGNQTPLLPGLSCSVNQGLLPGIPNLGPTGPLGPLGPAGPAGGRTPTPARTPPGGR